MSTHLSTLLNIFNLDDDNVLGGDNVLDSHNILDDELLLNAVVPQTPELDHF